MLEVSSQNMEGAKSTIEKKENESKQEIVSPEAPLDEPAHPLHSTWTLWYDNQLSGGKRPSNWGSNLQEVYSFSTVRSLFYFLIRYYTREYFLL